MKPIAASLLGAFLLSGAPAVSFADSPVPAAAAQIRVTGDAVAASGALDALAAFLRGLADPAVSEVELAASFASEARLEWVATPTVAGGEAAVRTLLQKLEDRSAPRTTFRLASARAVNGHAVEIDGTAISRLAPNGRPGQGSGRTLHAGAHVRLERGADGRWLITRWRVGKWSVVR